MQKFIGQRLRSARRQRGMSMADLQAACANRIKTSTISRYEKGEITPSPDNWIILASALEVKPGYFSKPVRVAVESVEYRKLARLSARRCAAIEELVKDRVERYIEVEEILDIRDRFENPLKGKVIASLDDIEDAVDALLKKWELGFNPLPNVLNQLEDLSIKVVEVKEDQKFEGLAMWVNQRIPVIVVNSNFTTEKLRFTALHELGHLLLNLDAFEKGEKACHRFAGAMLFPRRRVHAEFGDLPRHKIHINELEAINAFYGISLQAALYRLLHLNIITEDSIAYFYRTWFRNNREEIGLRSYPGQEKTMRFRQLVSRAEAMGIIDAVKAADLLNQPVKDYQHQASDGEAYEDPSGFAEAAVQSMNTYYDDDSDDYTDVPLVEVNPDYEGWRHLQSRI
jgi:Zn-dependent peptidase ImmA (M78 family)